MFVFKVKDDLAAIDISVTRALLGLAAIVVILYRNNIPFIINILAAVLLIVAAIYIRQLLLKFLIRKLLLIGIAAIMVFVVTQTLSFPIFLVFYTVVIQLLHKQPLVIFKAEGVNLKKMIGCNDYSWNEFSNVLLKDNLLTLDFKNNRLLQLDIEKSCVIDEKEFNDFCSLQMSK